MDNFLFFSEKCIKKSKLKSLFVDQVKPLRLLMCKLVFCTVSHGLVILLPCRTIIVLVITMIYEHILVLTYEVKKVKTVVKFSALVFVLECILSRRLGIGIRDVLKN